MDHQERKKRELADQCQLVPMRVVGWYLGVGATWILFSDQVLELWTPPGLLTRLQTIKGWLFLAVTSVLLWSLIRRGIAVIGDQHRRITLLNSELEQKVAQRTAEYAQTNELLKQEVQQRKQTEQQISLLNAGLMHQKMELEAANRELEAFSYSVSHDLRAPLRRITSFANLLQEECGTQLSQTGLQHLKRILVSTERLELLIAELLELARIGRSEMHLRKLDLTGMAREIAEELSRGEPARQVEFEIEDGVEAFGDPTLVRTVLVNLLGNAFKYTGKTAGGKIMFSVNRHRGYPVYEVRDNGAGFDMRLASKLFTPFQRLHDGTEFEGVGVGLAIVQRIVQRHGGQVWAEGTPGKGAVFSFSLGERGP